MGFLSAPLLNHDMQTSSFIRPQQHILQILADHGLWKSGCSKSNTQILEFDGPAQVVHMKHAVKFGEGCVDS